jgi:hypothetical protein
MDEGAEEAKEPQRPRVVDKRVSTRGVDPAPSPEPAPAESVAPPPEDAPARAPEASPQTQTAEETDLPEDERLWTPEQEEQARRFAQEIRDTPSGDWVLNVAVTLANVAATKLDAGLAADAQVAIDALAGMVNAVGPRLGDAGNALRQTVAQLQMAYTQAVPPPQP